ncbi:acyl-CoA oxidase 1, partial [Prunus dulcis]
RILTLFFFRNPLSPLSDSRLSLSLTRSSLFSSFRFFFFKTLTLSKQRRLSLESSVFNRFISPDLRSFGENIGVAPSSISLTLLWQGMFVPFIKGSGTEEQQEKWLPLAYKMQIIGCYAQTELGHGSNVQGLETTATFDPKTDEFVLNSPTLTSSKWWPGGLGKAATHTVAFARLITDGKDHGVNGFIVQLRNLDDHLPLPGITVGDIGMKFGNGAYNSMDNGVLRFDNVIDYKTQQSRLFPLLASAYAFRFVGEWLKWLYTDVTQKLQANDFSTLPEAHACTAGLKSLTTSATAAHEAFE